MATDPNPEQQPEDGPRPSTIRRIRGWVNAQNPARIVEVVPLGDGRQAYRVPSETKAKVAYDVFVDEDGQFVCAPCPDFAAYRMPCKHIYEVLDRFLPTIAPPRPTVEQADRGWYSGARRNIYEPFDYSEGPAESTRKDHALEDQDPRVEDLLVDLAAVINARHPRPPYAYRPELPPGDKVLITILRLHHRKSIRKFRATLKRLAAEGKIAFAPCKTTIIGYSKTDELESLLYEAFALATDPYRILETDVIVDSTGISPFYVSNWSDRRAEENAGRPPTDYRPKTEWFKVHILIGRVSKAILGWFMTPERGAGTGDTSLFQPLLDSVLARDFEPTHAIADNAYLTEDLYKDALKKGVMLVAPLKPRNRDKETGLPKGIAKRVAAFAAKNPDLYEELVHARQAVEGVFSVDKRHDNRMAAIGTGDERKAHALKLHEAAVVAEDETLDEDDRDELVKALRDEAAVLGLYQARMNEMLAKAVGQVVRQTVRMEHLWNRRISYRKGSVFGPVRETIE